MSQEETAIEAPAEDAPEVAAPAPSAVATAPAAKVSTADADVETRKNRKTREGLVVSDKMDKTAVVAVIERVRHAKYGKFMMRTKRLYAHDEANDAHTGDKVRVMETRPLSKNKRWRIVEVLERAK
jgi:small subunit ribosomal protein S17